MLFMLAKAHGTAPPPGTEALRAAWRGQAAPAPWARAGVPLKGDLRQPRAGGTCAMAESLLCYARPSAAGNRGAKQCPLTSA